MKKSTLFLAVLALTTTQFALAMPGDGRDHAYIQNRKQPSEPNIVKWVGVVKGDGDYHTTDHDHELKFVRQSDQENFDIVDSPKLVKLHHETEKNYLMEIEAEKTSRFLFWGGNLIVKNFKILKELETVAHKKPVRTPVRTFSDRR